MFARIPGAEHWNGAPEERSYTLLYGATIIEWSITATLFRECLHYHGSVPRKGLKVYFLGASVLLLAHTEARSEYKHCILYIMAL